MKRKMMVMAMVIRPLFFGLTSIVVVVALSEILRHVQIRKDHRVPCLTLVKPTPREGAL